MFWEKEGDFERFCWPESSTVEFKQALPGRDGRDDAWLNGGDVERYARDKLLKEVVAFANTSGGHLVLGVAETREAPASARALTSVLRCAELAVRLARAAQAVDPPVPHLLVRGVPIQGDAGIVVFRVPESRSAPHRAPDKECYVRRGTESVPIGMREIQDMTLAAGRRGEAFNARFEQAAREFAEWLGTPLDGRTQEGRTEAVGLRITAVPAGARFDLGRLYGRDALLDLRQRTPFAVDGHRCEAFAVRLPDQARPIVRGVRLTPGGDGDSVYLALHSDGTVDLGFRVTPRNGERLLAAGWVIAYAVNVLRAADALRTEAGAPDAECGLEMEIRAEPEHGPISLLGWGRGVWDDRIGDGVRRTPLLLPRLGFGPIGELDRVVALMVNDLCDAAASHHRQPFSLSIDPLPGV